MFHNTDNGGTLFDKQHEEADRQEIAYQDKGALRSTRSWKKSADDNPSVSLEDVSR